MTHLKTTVTFVLCVVAQACAIETHDAKQEPSSTTQGQPSQTPGGDPVSVRCERLDDLGFAATGVVLQKSDPMAQDAPCLDLDGDRIASFASRTCQLVQPESFSLNGCVDTYDCEGCTIELRSDDDYGFVVRGTSSSAACADLAAKYALVSSLECDAHIDHI